MRSDQKISSWFHRATICFSLLASILQALAILLEYDVKSEVIQSNYFRVGAILPVIAVCLALLGAATATIAARLTPTQALKGIPFSHKSIASPITFGIFAAIVLLAVASTPAVSSTITLFTCLFLCIALLYTILCDIPLARKNNALVSALGLFSILGTILLNAYYYFDTSLEMNSPIKVTTQVGLLCTMLTFTGEIRYLLGKPLPRTYFMLCGWTLSSASLSSISVPLAFLMGYTNRLDYVAGALFVFTASLTTCIRMRRLFFAPPHTPEASSEAEEIHTTDSLED